MKLFSRPVLMSITCALIGAGCLSTPSTTVTVGRTDESDPLPVLTKPDHLGALRSFHQNGIQFSYPSEWGALPLRGDEQRTAIGQENQFDHQGPPTTYFHLFLDRQPDEHFPSLDALEEACEGRYSYVPLRQLEGCARIQGRQTVFVSYDTDAYGYFVQAIQIIPGPEPLTVTAETPVMDYDQSDWLPQLWTVFESLQIGS